MSYQVLARKLRPADFDALVGQEHVVRALTHALESGRVHHAYLFTGTRGVGKTTIARVLAKCLNCERGVTAKPCGHCGICREISEGRFVDLIEVDAASRTKVDDTRDLLDNVQYLPARGRYKVYLIDEVHMLSTASFNALLKTLEEPPEHVKFLLATTDPKKVPITVLSRCLQFQLKNLLPERISSYLAEVLTKEQVAFDAESLELIARAARGSMRDALSILDQSIAFCGGELKSSEVGDLLGTIERRELESLLEALAGCNGVALMAAADELAERAADFKEVLSALLSILHELAVAVVVPERDGGLDPLVVRFRERFDAETLQLLYQIVLMGIRDLPLAPDPRTGFEMTLLRALAFQPTTDEGGEMNAGSDRPAQRAEQRGAGRDAGKPAAKPSPRSASNVAVIKTVAHSSAAAPRAAQRTTPAISRTSAVDVASEDPAWHELIGALDLGGVARMIAEHSVLVRRDQSHWQLTLDAAHDTLLNDRQREVIERAIARYTNTEVQLEVAIGEVTGETPAVRGARLARERHAAAVAALHADATVQALIGDFDAELKLDSVGPIGSPQEVK